ncbi:hypothetical protein E2562_028138 [Oryza meyeriana var. granulata]|uniref:F-box domain-containing protein n=1 Tax=Oryza meyeriana var. granulata TaxID=110450 RepID=A0A6G1D8E1_9ORYZ|nr:hypothetical protein E2562_028138 [Oryza meyeriana var. granulata]
MAGRRNTCTLFNALPDGIYPQLISCMRKRWVWMSVLAKHWRQTCMSRAGGCPRESVRKCLGHLLLLRDRSRRLDSCMILVCWVPGGPVNL